MWMLKIVKLSINKLMKPSLTFNHRLFTCTIAGRSRVMGLIHSIHKGY